jgi:arginase
VTLVPAVALIGVPSSAGARNVGQEGAPAALAAAGLTDALRGAGLEIRDLGSLPRVTFAPDPLAPRAQNLPLVAAVARMVAERVRAAREAGALPLVVGGDCTVTLGVVAGASSGASPLGLVYFDGDVDMNVPEDSPSGIFDGMVLAHLLGQGAGALRRIGSRFPLVREEEVALFGYNPDAGYIDPGEESKLLASSIRRYPVSSLRGRAAAAAREALASFPAATERVLVHFDVDVVDGDEFGAADLPHRGGLSLRHALEALRVFVQTERFAGLVVTEFNVAHDPQGELARRLVAGLADAFRGAPWA